MNLSNYTIRSVTVADNNKTTHEMELLHQNDNGFCEKLDTVLYEERIWDDFRVCDYHNSHGITEKYHELSNGTRIAEHYDALTKTYSCSIFDRNGSLLREEQHDVYGRYVITERMDNGANRVITGSSVFIRSIDGTIPMR